MKKIFISILAIVSLNLFSQTNISPQLISSAGGSGFVNSVYYDYSVGEPITLFGGPACDSIFSGFQHCAIDTFRIKKNSVTIGGATTFCQGMSVLLSAPAGSAFLWAPGGVTTQTLSVTQSGSYHVRVTNSCGDTISSNSVIVNVITPPVPNICLISTDSTSTNNIIYWDNTLYPAADSFVVYRYDVSSTQYVRLGALSKDSSRFVDVMRNIGGPNGGDPQYGSWQYKLALVDTCHNESVKSPYHQSLFIQENLQNFTWNAYTIEAGQSNPVTGYAFSRDDNNTGNWNVLVNTTGLSTTDPNYLSYPNGNWRVDALGFTCTGSARLANGSTLATIVKSRSNVKNNRTTAINKLFKGDVRIYPNPSNGYLTINVSSLSGSASAEIYNIIGENVLTQKLQEQTTQLDISEFKAGVYEVRLLNRGIIVYREKVIKQ